MIRSPNLVSSVEKAERRFGSLDTDLAARKEFVRDNPPAALASEVDKRQRRRFLENLYDQSGEGDRAFERIIHGNELQDASFLARGALVARAVMRIVLSRPGGGVYGSGTGFLVGDGVLITNNHVLPRVDVAASAHAEVFYERDIYGRDSTALRFTLDPSTFYTSEDLDFTFTGIAPRDVSGKHQLSDLGWLPLIGGSGKAAEGEWLSIIQHPNGERKQLCVRENKLLKRDTDVLWYSTDTLAGSSGSPVFNNDWLLVALHHSGVPEKRDDKWQTIDGRDYDPARDAEDQIKWIANEGIRVSRIVETLRSDARARNDARLQAVVNHDVGDLRARLPVLYRAGTEPSAEIENLQCMVNRGGGKGGSPPSIPALGSIGNPTPSNGSQSVMSERLINVTLAVGDDGAVRVIDQSSDEAFSFEAKKPKGVVIDAPVEEDRDWAGLGFDTSFLDVDGEGRPWHVNLPTLSQANTGLVAPLQTKKAVYGLPIPADDVAGAGRLNYLNSTVVMNGTRRLAFYSAANIDGAQRFDLSRPTDSWLLDKRIAREYQLDNSYYSNNKFDRGHLTRREDLEWGRDPVIATRRANGTCTWTNCSPQHKTFNQDKDFPGKTAALWAGLERYILEDTARHYKFRVQSFTGPVFDDNDLPYRGARVPSRFWKVVVAVDAQDRLFATAYVLSQQQLLDLDRNNLEEAAIEVPFGKFEAYQVEIAELEKEIGMTFTGGDPAKPVSLSKFDPLAKELAKPAWKRRKRRARAGAEEALGAGDRLFGGALEGFGDIVLPED